MTSKSSWPNGRSGRIGGQRGTSSRPGGCANVGCWGEMGTGENAAHGDSNLLLGWFCQILRRDNRVYLTQCGHYPAGLRRPVHDRDVHERERLDSKAVVPLAVSKDRARRKRRTTTGPGMETNGDNLYSPIYPICMVSALSQKSQLSCRNGSHARKKRGKVVGGSI